MDGHITGASNGNIRAGVRHTRVVNIFYRIWINEKLRSSMILFYSSINERNETLETGKVNEKS